MSGIFKHIVYISVCDYANRARALIMRPNFNDAAFRIFQYRVCWARFCPFGNSTNTQRLNTRNIK